MAHGRLMPEGILADFHNSKEICER